MTSTPIVAPLLPLAFAAAFARPQAAAAPHEPFVEFKAGAGTRFSVLEVKDAPRESFLAFLPGGLLADEAGQTQYAHLLEHMLIRSTDRDGLSEGEFGFNGETDELALRLEIYAPPKLAGAALKKLIGWLQATEFDPAVLAAEKTKIGVELDTTCEGGFTHKWAVAAWNQVARHGQHHVAVRGDVMAATAEQIEAVADERVVLAQVRIVAVGPLNVEAVKALAQPELARAQGLGALAGAIEEKTAQRHAAEAAKRAKSALPLASGDLVATWDLPNSHVLAWYLLPNATVDDAAAALALAQLANVRLPGDSRLRKLKVIATASADLVVPEGRVMMLSASLRGGGADADDVVAVFDAAVAELLAPVPSVGSIENYLKLAAGEFRGLPDFGAQRRQLAGRPGADLLEAQVALNMTMRELASGHPFGELGAAFARLTRPKLEALAAARLIPAKRSTLRLTPKG